MRKSIELSTEDQTNEAMNALLQAATGLDLYGLQWYLRNSTSLSSEMAWDRLGRGHDWTIHDLAELGKLWDVPPSTLVTAVLSVAGGAEPQQAIFKYGLDLKRFTDQVSEEGSIAKLYEPEVSNALTVLLLEGAGAPEEIRLPLVAWELGNRNVGPGQRITSLLRFEVNTSSGYLTWVEEDLPALAKIMYTTPDKLLDAAIHVAEHPGDEGALRDARNIIWGTEEVAR